MLFDVTVVEGVDMKELVSKVVIVVTVVDISDVVIVCVASVVDVVVELIESVVPISFVDVRVVVDVVIGLEEVFNVVETT